MRCGAGLSDLAAGDLVLIACSGGADSLALAAAAAFAGPRMGLKVGGVTVDHGLQSGSAERAAGLAALLARLCLDPVRSLAVTVPPAPAAAGPEAAARTARYAALDAVAQEHGAVAVLLGHTLDDQAETVLLGLARGSGGRSLAGDAAPGAAGIAGRPAGRAPRHHRCRLRRAGPRALAGPAQPGLPVCPGRGAASGAARARGRPRAGGGRGAGPHRGPAAGGRRVPGGAGVRRKRKAPSDAASNPAGLDVPWLRDLAAAIRTRVLRDAAIMAGPPAWVAHGRAYRPGGRTGHRLARAALGRPCPAVCARAARLARCGSAAPHRASRCAPPGEGKTVGRT